MILATVSSDAGFHRDVRAALEGHLRFEFSWDLGYQEAARLRGLDSTQKVDLGGSGDFGRHAAIGANHDGGLIQRRWHRPDVPFLGQ